MVIVEHLAQSYVTSSPPWPKRYYGHEATIRVWYNVTDFSLVSHWVDGREILPW